MSDRNGDWMQTYLGKQFWPIDPRPEDVYIEDIAHALSMVCRYNGHCNNFYSVSEHSVHIARALRKEYGSEIALWGLLHDASEAYISDINRPTKPYLENYVEIESKIMTAICIRFHLPIREPKEVKIADNAILVDELCQNMTEPPVEWNIPDKGLGVKLQFWSPQRAKTEFLTEFTSLILK